MNGIRSRIASITEYMKRPGTEAGVAILYHDGEQYCLVCTTVNGKTIETTHDTELDARTAYANFLIKHPAPNPTFIIADVTGAFS